MQDTLNSIVDKFQVKNIALLIIILVALLSCSRDWNSPLESDVDLLHQPQILNITQDATGFKLQLDYSYSANAVLLFERKIAGAAYEPITMQKLSSSVFADSTLDMEFDHNLSYRLRVQKGEYYTDYSNVEPYNYTSIILNSPSGFSASTIELQGVRLNWQDNSGKETGYKIEKNLNGAGYTEIASLPANTETYMDNISGMPASPLSLIYRVRAYTANLTSAWQEQNVIYSGLGAPTNLIITDHSFYHFSLAWTRNSTIATGYQIESKKDGGAYALLAIVGTTVQTYNTELLENGSYTFRVRAVRNSDYSTYTNEVNQQINIVMPTNGLIAYYPFNGNANDESGNGHNGIVNGATLASDRFGSAGKAYDFDGVDDYIECPSTGNLSTAFNEITLSGWVNIEDWDHVSQDNSNWAAIFCKGPTHMQIEEAPGWDNRYGLYFGYGDPFSDYLDSSIFMLNQWYQVAIVCNENTIQFYMNGAQTHTAQANVTIDSNSEPLLIGKDPPGYIDYLVGKLDDLRIYNRALTEPEIQALYHESGWTGSK